MHMHNRRNQPLGVVLNIRQLRLQIACMVVIHQRNDPGDDLPPAARALLHHRIPHQVRHQRRPTRRPLGRHQPIQFQRQRIRQRHTQTRRASIR